MGGGDDGEGTSDGGDSGVSGTIDTMGFSLEDVIAKDRVQTVKEQYPDLTIDIASGGFDEQQFLTALASGNPPSVVYMERNDLGSYAARDALMPLDDCLADNDVDLADYREAALAQVTYDDTVYGVPEFNSVRVVLGNTAALDEAGLAAADLDTADWEALSTTATALYRAEGDNLSRLGFDPKIPEFFPLWVAANGGELLSEDGLTASIDSPEAVEALEYAVSLVEEQGGWARLKAFRDNWDFFGDQNQLVSDQVGGFVMEDWYLDVLADVSPDAPVVAVPFKGRNGEPLTYATGNTWAVPKGAENPEAACAFAAAMTATDTWVSAAEASKADREKSGGEYLGTWTANEQADERILAEVYEPAGVPALADAVEVVRDVQSVAIADPPSPAAAEVKKAWEDAVLRALEGEQSAQEALTDAQEEAQSAIDESAS